MTFTSKNRPALGQRVQFTHRVRRTLTPGTVGKDYVEWKRYEIGKKEPESGIYVGLRFKQNGTLVYPTAPRGSGST